MPEPQRGVAYTFSLALLDALTGSLRVNPTLAVGDFRVARDHGAFVTLATLPSVAPAGSVDVQVQLTAVEMTANQVDVWAHDPDGEWDDVLIQIQPSQAYGNDHKVLLSSDTQPTLAVNVIQLAGNVSSPGVLDRSARTMVRGVVGAGATTTTLPTSVLTPAATVTDQFASRVVIFDETTATAALRSQARDITASTAGGVLTVSALTTAPASGDTFIIV